MASQTFGNSGEKKGDKDILRIFKDVIVENCSSFIKDIVNTFRSLINSISTNTKDIITETHYKEIVGSQRKRILKAASEKKLITYMGSIGFTAVFSSDTSDKKGENWPFRPPKEKTANKELYIWQKYPSKSRRDKIFLDKQNPREYTVIIPSLQEILTGIIQAEIKGH